MPLRTFEETSILARRARKLLSRERGAFGPSRVPAAPTRDEVEEHEASGHANCRTWCTACIAGRGRADAHVGAIGGEHASHCPIFLLKSGRDRWVSSELYSASDKSPERLVCEFNDGALATFHNEVGKRARDFVVANSYIKACAYCNGEGDCHGGLFGR